MKRLLVVALLASVMLVAFAGAAYAIDYKLTTAVYWDADGDGIWDACEPIVPGAEVRLNWTGYYAPNVTKYTDACGYAKFMLPAGQVVYGWVNYGSFKGVFYDKWTEATPLAPEYDVQLGVAKVVMNRNRCMLFGVSNIWNVLNCAPPACEPCPTEECVTDDHCTCDYGCKCPPKCECGCKYHR